MLKHDVTPKYRKKYDMICDDCRSEYNYGWAVVMKGRKKFNRDLCRGCKMKIEYSNGERRYSKNALAYHQSRRGKSFEEQFGKEKALSAKIKMSQANAGENNPNFGKPAAAGSGRGWGGWYGHLHFRSSLELSFILQCEKCGKSLETAERKEYSLQYKNAKGTIRTYFPDFILDGKIVEIKPRNMFHLNETRVKIEMAKEKWGDQFQVITNEDIEQITDEKILELYNDGKIKPDKNFDKKIQMLLMS